MMILSNQKPNIFDDADVGAQCQQANLSQAVAMLGSKYVNTLVKGKPLHYKPQFMMRVLSIIVFYTVNNPGWNAHDVQNHCCIEKLPF